MSTSTSDNPRDRFAALLEELQSCVVSVQGLQWELEDEILAKYRELRPRLRREVLKKALEKVPEKGEPGRWGFMHEKLRPGMEEEWDGIVERYHRLAAEKQDQTKAKREAIKATLEELARDLNPQSGNTWHKYESVCSSSYHTQGFGAHSYAEGAAKQYLPELLALGLEAEVRRVPWRDRNSNDPRMRKTDITDYDVWVKCEPVDYEIAKRKPSMTVKDWLQWCWDHGYNPRVFNPFLPHGLEEELKVSYTRCGNHD